MQRYVNLVQDSAGTAIGSVTVTVYATGTSNLSTLYSDNLLTALANPFTNDSDGTFEFYATNGRYDVVLARTGYTFTAANTTDILLLDNAVTGTTYASPVFSGSITGTYTLAGTPTITAPAISSPVLSGTATGTYTLAGTPTFTSPTINTPTIASPVLSGTATGTYTLAGTPTFTSPTITGPTVTGTLTMTDAVFRVIGSAGSTKVMNFECDGATAATTLTLASIQTTSQTLNVPNITATDTIDTLALAQTITGVKTMTNMTTAAGTSAIPSMTITGGALLTSAVAGGIENDSIGMCLTTNTTDGRGHIPARQHFKLTADGGAITTIANFFGATSNISLVASAFYYIEIVMYFLKTTSEATTVTLTNSAAPTSQNIRWEQSPITGVVAPPGTATGLLGHTVNDATATLAIVTGSLTTGVHHCIRLHIELNNGTGTSLKIQHTNAAGSTTPQNGSYWTAVRIPTANTGTFAA